MPGRGWTVLIGGSSGKPRTKRLTFAKDTQTLASSNSEMGEHGKPLRTHCNNRKSQSYECMGCTRVGEGACPALREVDQSCTMRCCKINEIAKSETAQNLAADEPGDMLTDGLRQKRGEIGGGSPSPSWRLSTKLQLMGGPAGQEFHHRGAARSWERDTAGEVGTVQVETRSDSAQTGGPRTG